MLFAMADRTGGGSSGATRTDEVHRRLRAEILAGRRPAGQRLKFAALQQELGVSVGVIREALVKLAEQGLVVGEPQIGFRVTPVTERDLLDLTEARVAIEGMVFRLAILEGDVNWEAKVVAAHHVLERTPLAGKDDVGAVSEAWAAAHMAFHLSLLAGCPNQRLRNIASALRDSAELYRSLSQNVEGGPRRPLEEEHARLLQAVVQRDPDLGVQTLSEHIRRTSEMLAPWVTRSAASVVDA